MTAPDLIAFVTARLDEREALARAASDRGKGAAEHWRWESTQTDTPVPLEDIEEALEHQSISLRSVETYPTTSVGDLPSFAIHSVDEYTPALAHIAANDPAHVLREVAAMRAIVDAAVSARAIANRLGEETPEWCALRFVVERLATIWSEHADYRAGWAP